jgi:PAS domain-containing protein
MSVDRSDPSGAALDTGCGARHTTSMSEAVSHSGKPMTIRTPTAHEPLDRDGAAAVDVDGHLLRAVAGAASGAADASLTRPAGSRERRYRRFLDALGVALYTTDAAGRITFFNEAAASFWGRRPQLDELWCGSFRLYWPNGDPMAQHARELTVRPAHR